VTDPSADLVKKAALGLPYESKRIVRRALMHLPWRMFVGRQVAFNRAAAAEIATLRKAVRRLRTEVDGLAEVAAASQRDNDGMAAREQLHRIEGELRRDLSALQIEVARLTAEARRS